VRYALPRMSRVLPIPALVVAGVGLAERCRFKRLDFAYVLALEYFFLIGVQEASRDAKLTARGRRW
jgi:hypothetical protein